MSIGYDRIPGGPQHARPWDGATQVLVAAAFAWGILVILAAMALPVVTVAAPPVTATAPPVLSSPASPNPHATGQQLFASPRVTVLTHDGAAGVALAGVPAATSVLVGGLLWSRSRRRRRRGMLTPIIAWTLSVALLAAGIVGFLTFLVGIVAVPAGVLLVLACSRAAPLRPRTIPAVSASREW